MSQPSQSSAKPSARMPKRWSTSLARRLLLSAASLLVALALAEAALHLFRVPVRDDRIARDPVLGWRNRAGWSGPVFSVNSLGFIGPEFSAEKPDGVVRVFCLGDSCTAGDLLPDCGDTYPSQLERELAERYPRLPVQVINAGVGGYSSFQGRLWLEREIVHYGPDVAVVSFGWNDHWPARAGGQDREVAGSFGERVRAWLSWCKLLQLGIKAYHVIFGSATLPTEQEAGEAGPARSERLPRVSLDDYAANLRSIVEAMRERGGEAVLITAPNLLRSVPDDHPAARAFGPPDAVAALVDLHAAYCDVARAVAADEGICLVDAAADFAAAEAPEMLFWQRPGSPRDFIHLSPEGYARLAESVAQCPAFKKLAENRSPR